ncbi:uncharacterized protein PV09_09396 [Verruconis gallopava]|uniref:Cytochrome P450 oxidoreductase n=1 Tax=Verruconis gallopava TaxID=253628 RepID=A0A0D1ZXL5_9PEZI|nr:uncharacterized protein PV09_09396 [Verruconis gallopava]KIV98824.1 hypothetical protein PV09_09396 [Verruconis gallopava]
MLFYVVNYVLQSWTWLLPTIIIAYFISNKYRYGISCYPGPWLAAYTDWWRFFDAANRKTEKTFLELHEKYGDIVRIGPNALSFADPRSIKCIYGLNKGLVKSEFYPVQQGVSKGRRLPSLFSTVDEAYHAQYRRCVNNAFSMSSLVSYEPLVDSTLVLFLDQTERNFQKTAKECDLARWFQFFAFDVIGELTWSKRLGFLEKNQDIDGIIAFISKFLDYAGPVGQMPFLDYLFGKNIVHMQLQRWGISKAVFPATKFALSRQAERDKLIEAGMLGNFHADLLSKFMQAQKDHPDIMTDDLVLTTCLSMILAGSETTAISLSAIFYYLLKNPSAYKKLMHEIDEAVKSGLIDRESHVVSWKASQKLVYLDAVIQEAFRVHPAAGLMLERVTPKQGLDVVNQRIPGGIIVGCNAWVLHRRPEIFGEDVHMYRPERWINASPEKLKEMKATMFQFGAGSRTCIGKNISLLEIYKLVPSLLRRFDIELAEPDQEWSTFNAWFLEL